MLRLPTRLARLLRLSEDDSSENDASWSKRIRTQDQRPIAHSSRTEADGLNAGGRTRQCDSSAMRGGVTSKLSRCPNRANRPRKQRDGSRSARSKSGSYWLSSTTTW